MDCFVQVFCAQNERSLCFLPCGKKISSGDKKISPDDMKTTLGNISLMG